MRTSDDSRPYRTRQTRRVLSPEELQLWQRATADVRPMFPGERDEQVAVAEVPKDPSEASPKAVASSLLQGGPPAPMVPVVVRPRPVESRPPLTELSPGSAPGLDIRTLMRLKRGLFSPQSEIDLHQCTQAEAHALLRSFLTASQARGRRCVLVITGKGYGPGGTVGVLKTMVPRWLNEPPVRSIVIAFTHAIPQHGGEGALYVLLRRRRERT